MKTSTSGNTHCGIGSPATANAVACGGWQWTTAFTSARAFMIARCSRISLVRFCLSGDLVAVHVDGTDIVRRHEALADHRRRANDFVLAHADRHVAVIGGGEALVVHPPADFADQLFELAVVDSAIPAIGRWSRLTCRLHDTSLSVIESYVAFYVRVRPVSRNVSRRRSTSRMAAL